jgi:inhibitor of cysteine peptidase
VEVSQKDWQGNEIDTVAYYQGMKIALFDVTNVEKPVEKFKVLIGDRGTESELLRNHKALLFSKEKNLLAFPVTVMERKDESQEAYEYGEFTFQGAYVYKLDLEKGFQLRGKITHLSADDYQKAGYGWYNSPKNVERIIYIGDTLYTLSRYMLVAHDLDSLHEINKIIFE